MSAYVSAMHPNERLLRDGYEAMGRGDGRALAKLLGPGTRWVIAGRGPVSGTYEGPDEIFAFWKKTAEQTGGGLTLNVRDVLANDHRGVVLVDVEGTRNGRELHERQVVVFELDHGKVASATFIYEDPQAYDDFWTDE